MKKYHIKINLSKIITTDDPTLEQLKQITNRFKIPEDTELAFDEDMTWMECEWEEVEPDKQILSYKCECSNDACISGIDIVSSKKTKNCGCCGSVLIYEQN